MGDAEGKVIAPSAKNRAEKRAASTVCDWKIRLSRFLLSHRYIFQIIRDFVTVLGCKLTNFEPRLLSRAVVVHPAHKRAHLHRVLVLMVQAVGLEEAEESHEDRIGLEFVLTQQDRSYGKGDAVNAAAVRDQRC